MTMRVRVLSVSIEGLSAADAAELVGTAFVEFWRASPWAQLLGGVAQVDDEQPRAVGPVEPPNDPGGLTASAGDLAIGEAASGDELAPEGFRKDDRIRHLMADVRQELRRGGDPSGLGSGSRHVGKGRSGDRDGQA